MQEANEAQINWFRHQYCKSGDKRLKMNEDFEVKVLSYEELLPGNIVRSYASGNKEICGAFIVFEVSDLEREIIYYPVFSESVGRELIRAWDMKLPSKMTVFIDDGNGGGGGHRDTGERDEQKKKDNRKMLLLILLARSMMILHVKEPEPMRDPFKRIYNKLLEHKKYNVFESDIKIVNSAIQSFLKKPINLDNENFVNLQDYIRYLQNQYPNRKLRKFDFDVLRNKMKEAYPDENIVF